MHHAMQCMHPPQATRMQRHNTDHQYTSIQQRYYRLQLQEIEIESTLSGILESLSTKKKKGGSPLRGGGTSNHSFSSFATNHLLGIELLAVSGGSPRIGRVFRGTYRDVMGARLGTDLRPPAELSQESRRTAGKPEADLHARLQCRACRLHCLGQDELRRQERRHEHGKLGRVE